VTENLDLEVPITIDGTNYGAPLENFKTALRAAGLESVNLWIGTGGLAVARLVVPVLKPKAYLPVHWDGLWGAFETGVPHPYTDAPLGEFLQKSGVQLLSPHQYGDKWRLDARGVRPVPNDALKRTLGWSKN